MVTGLGVQALRVRVWGLGFYPNRNITSHCEPQNWTTGGGNFWWGFSGASSTLGFKHAGSSARIFQSTVFPFTTVFSHECRWIDGSASKAFMMSFKVPALDENC